MMPTMLFKFAKAIWITLGVIVLFVTLYRFDGKPNSDIGVFLAWSMLALAFPSSLLVAGAFTGISIAAESFFSTVIPTSYWWIAITWLCFFVVGYLQWFVLLPWLWHKWRAQRTTGAAIERR